jgi:hypothetical protein
MSNRRKMRKAKPAGEMTTGPLPFYAELGPLLAGELHDKAAGAGLLELTWEAGRTPGGNMMMTGVGSASTLTAGREAIAQYADTFRLEDDAADEVASYACAGIDHDTCDESCDARMDRGERVLSGWALMAHGKVAVPDDGGPKTVPVLVNVLVQLEATAA